MMHGGKWLGFWAVFVATGVVGGALTQGCGNDRATIFYPDPEGGAPGEGGAGPSTAPTCPAEEPVQAKSLEWRPPTPLQAGQCQDDDVAAARAYLDKTPGVSNEDFENFMKNRDRICHDCIFGDANAQTWSAAPLKDGKVLTFNIGACYAIVTGSQECGKAIQNAWDCGFEACLLCKSADAVPACRAKARSGACLAFEDRAKVACGATSAADELCGSPFDSIREQCIASALAPKDAGAD